MAPVEIDLLWNALAVRPTGWHRLWSLRREVTVPYEQIVTVTHDPAFARNGPVGLRFPGTNVFGSYIAGTYWKFWDRPRVRSFWVRRHAEKCITLKLRDHWFDVICVEVDDPAAEVERIRAAIAEQSPVSEDAATA